MNTFDKVSRRLPGPKRQLRNIELRRSDDCIIAMVEDRGYIFARTYFASSFADDGGAELSDAGIIKLVRREYREHRRRFKPYNQSTGQYTR